MNKQIDPKQSKKKTPHEASRKEAGKRLQGVGAPKTGAARLLGLQKQLGNRAVRKMVQGATIQNKLKVSQPGDQLEREAEENADQVMRMSVPTPSVSQKNTAALLPRKALQKQDQDELGDPVVDTHEETVDPKIWERIRIKKGTGQKLADQTRSFFEERMGADFSSVRVHTDGEAAQLSDALNARAFAQGKDIFFANGQYAPGTPEGKRLLAHELTHVIQQGAAEGTIRRKTETTTPAGTANTGNTTQMPKTAKAPGLMNLKGKGKISPSDPAARFLTESGLETAQMEAAFGNIARGTIELKRAGNIYSIQKQFLPMNHPLFNRIGEVLPAVQPGLIISSSGEDITGYVGFRESESISANAKDLARLLRDAPPVIGLQGIQLPQLPAVTNKLEAGTLAVGVKEAPIKVADAFSGTITITADDTGVTAFDGAANINIKGMAAVALNLQRSEKGVVTGGVDAEADLGKNVSGSIHLDWDGESLTGKGEVGYQGEKMSGNVTVNVMDKSKVPQEENAGGEAKQGKGKSEYVVFGEGDLTFAFNDWLAGTAHVILDHNGFLTIVGEIAPPAEVEIMPQKDFNKDLFKLEARAKYGIPVIGNIFIFANIGMDAFAKVGPAKLYNIKINGTYSTNPDTAMNFTLQGSLNFSAAAGLRLRGEAGVGLEILAHDIKAGAGINAIAAIKGYAEATPVIGYREVAGQKGEDKQGQFFIKGDVEMAAQPSLELNGDLFVEVDAPWWSPCPDKKWTWPLGGKTWSLGGELGIKASVEHVLGSGDVPEIEFKPADFDGDKFLTDLYSDSAQSGSGEKEAPAGWNDRNGKDTPAPTENSKKGNVKPGEAPKQSEAKPTVQPGGPKKNTKTADPNAVTADGRSVKQLQEEAAAKNNGTNKGANKDTNKDTNKGTGKTDGTTDPAKTIRTEEEKTGATTAPTKGNETKETAETTEEKPFPWWTLTETVNQEAETHSLYFNGDNENATLMMASTPRTLEQYLVTLRKKYSDTKPETLKNVERLAKRVDELKFKFDEQTGTKSDRKMTVTRGKAIAKTLQLLAAELAKLDVENQWRPPSQITFETRNYKGSPDGSRMVAEPLSINPKDELSGSIPSQSSKLWNDVNQPDRSGVFVRGHLLNHHVHGRGAVYNMTPITGKLNTQMEKEVESKVKQAVMGENDVVSYTVTAEYNEQPMANAAREAEHHLTKQLKFQLYKMKLKDEALTGKEPEHWIKDKKIPVPDPLPHQLPPVVSA